jgi:15-cis-phytoene synthase
MYGSAEVIGLMMAKILGLPQASFHAARLLGRAMQYINFIRDIQEDIDLCRVYLPQDQLEKFGIRSLNFQEAHLNKESFSKFIREQIKTYFIWQKEAESGYSFIPKKHLVPIRTAAEMYKWTAKKIYADPLIVFRKKVKPSRSRILVKGVVGSLLYNSSQAK